MEEMLLVYTTWPDAETAQAAGLAAVQARLAACANILAPINSIYCWKGAAAQHAETPMLLKTRRSCAPALRELILARHPYETPCFIALAPSPDASNSEFLRWIEEQTDEP
ncbi:MAG TPA: divalent-cation tolerance protein CutA [Caulobacteraceae bacterium]|nr:divalent-cation tolerance protein CutA [Caulobacteraceae bacterium]